MFPSSIPSNITQANTSTLCPEVRPIAKKDSGKPHHIPVILANTGDESAAPRHAQHCQDTLRHALLPLSFHLFVSLAGQAVGIKEVDHGIWLVSFMDYDLGYIDLEEKTLQPLHNPFGPKV